MHYQIEGEGLQQPRPPWRPEAIAPVHRLHSHKGKISGVPKVLVKISNVVLCKKIVKLKRDLYCLARMQTIFHVYAKKIRQIEGRCALLN